MNSRQKEVLTSCRTLLTRNIIWTPHLVSMLKEQGVLTDSMLADIEAAGERSEKVQALLDMLPLRGSHVYERFCDVLHLTGHLFLSDFLREEDSKKEGLDISDLYKRLPAMTRGLRESDKKQLETYISEKIQSETMKFIWKRDSKEKERWLETKQKQLVDAKEFEEERTQTLERISELERMLGDAKDAQVEARAERRVLERRLRDAQDEHKQNMNIQIRYNTANDAVIQRSEARVDQMVDMLKTIHNEINDLISLKPRKTEKETMMLKDNEFAFLLEDFESFVLHYKKLLRVQEAHEDLIEEKNLVLLHMGYSPDDHSKTSLLTAFKSFIVRNDENMHQLKREVSRYGALLKEQEGKVESMKHEQIQEEEPSDESLPDIKKSKMASGAAVWQAAIMTVMRKQISDLKTDARKKDTQVTLQEDEIAKQKTKIQNLEKQIAKFKERVREMEQLGGERRTSLNGRLSGSLDSLDAKTDGRRSSVLPPIRFGQIQPTSYSPVNKPTVQPRKHHASMPRNFNPEGHIVNLPDGLTTTPVRLENRGKNPMVNSVGDLKSIHNRHRTSAYNGRPSMTVGKDVSGVPRRNHGKYGKVQPLSKPPDLPPW